MTLDTRQGIEDDSQRGEIPLVKNRANDIVKIKQELEKTWQRTKETQTKWYNKNHKPRSFKVEDSVLLLLKNIKTIRTSKKLDYRFLGPFKIEKCIGNQAY